MPVPPLAFAPSLAPFIVMAVAGFMLGVGGHVYKSKTAVALGIGLIFLATVILPLALYGDPY